jgi:hypothetical protein
MHPDSGSLSLQTVEWALRTIELLVQASQPLSVREIAARIGINRTTAHRVRCIGAAVRSATGDPLFALSLTGPSPRFTNAICVALDPELVETAAALSEGFGYQTPPVEGVPWHQTSRTHVTYCARRQSRETSRPARLRAEKRWRVASH